MKWLTFWAGSWLYVVLLTSLIQIWNFEKAWDVNPLCCSFLLFRAFATVRPHSPKHKNRVNNLFGDFILYLCWSFLCVKFLLLFPTGIIGAKRTVVVAGLQMDDIVNTAYDDDDFSDIFDLLHDVDDKEIQRGVLSLVERQTSTATVEMELHDSLQNTSVPTPSTPTICSRAGSAYPIVYSSTFEKR